MQRRMGWPALMVVAVGLLLAGCEGDQGPAGPSGTAECANCHLDNEVNAEIIAFEYQWERSVHATGGHVYGGSCAGCHTSEGFQGLDASNPTPIGCFTCHDPHTNFNFNPRKRDPVTLAVGGAVFDHGKANLCANCHQMRSRTPWIDDFPTTPGSTHWGPHHGPQSNVYIGVGAYDFDEGAYGVHPFHSTAPDGCIQCHMAIPDEAGEPGFTGGHTLVMEYEDAYNVDGCNVVGCHGDDPLEDFSHGGVQAEIQAAIDELGPLAVQLGILNYVDGEYEVFEDRTYTKEEIGIALNYMILVEDRSKGVHNPTYLTQVAERTLTHARALAAGS